MNAETLQAIAQSFEVSPETLAVDIHRTCTWMQEQGNKGYSELQLKEADLPTYFLSADKALLDGMVFHAVPSRKKGEYSGWGVRRHPMVRDVLAWEVNWLHTFKHLQIELVQQVQVKIDKARNPDIAVGDWVEFQGNAYRVHSIRSSDYLLEDIYGWHGAAFAKRSELTKLDKPRRKQEIFSGGSFTQYTTFEIAYRAACAEVLKRWYLHHHSYEMGDHYKEAAHVWTEQRAILRNELTYRFYATPPQKESRKKTAEASDGWAMAGIYLEEGTGYFFSREFVEAVVNSVEYPDLAIDPEHLPKQTPAKTPIKWKSDRELMNDVMRWLNAEIDPDSFEYDDRKKFVDVARRWLATAKGEKVNE